MEAIPTDKMPAPARERNKQSSIRQDGGRLLITLEGPLDVPASEELKANLSRYDVSRVREAVFDFSEVTCLGSVALGKILLFYKVVNSGGGVVRIRNTPAHIYETFQTTDVTRIMDISRN